MESSSCTQAGFRRGGEAKYSLCMYYWIGTPDGDYRRVLGGVLGEALSTFQGSEMGSFSTASIGEMPKIRG